MDCFRAENKSNRLTISLLLLFSVFMAYPVRYAISLCATHTYKEVVE